MQVIELISEASLGYENHKVEGNLDLSFLDDLDNVTVITTCELVKFSSKRSKIINGTSRYNFKIDSDVVLYNVKSTSPYFANIFWDVAHSLSVGKKLYIYEETLTKCILESEYYTDAFKKTLEEGGLLVFEKIDCLLCEKDSGLDSWTFGIPVGPEEPTFLDYTVERIFNLGLTDYEIILCGKPHESFKYFDKVKIVGEDISAPPVHITKKKNVIAENATKKNLCILHDRVLLPLNFRDAINKFGDLFPIVGFQSFYFTDYYNFIPRKYSDFNTLSSSLSKHVDALNFDKESVNTLANNYNFYYQHPKRANFGRDYLTGSLYICKASLWRKYPQNEKLYWDDFEDVEYGSRTSLMGIPSIVNPYTLTQSMNSRSIIHYYGYVNANSKRGVIGLTRSITEIISFGKKKPLFRIDEKEAIQRISSFASKYSSNEDLIRFVKSKKLTGKHRLNIIVKIVNSLHVPIWKMKEFVFDFNRNILFEAMPPEHQKNMINYLSSNASPQDKKIFIINLPFLHNQLSNSLNYSSFLSSPEDWFSKKSKKLTIGCWLSAFNLKYLYRCAYFPMSVRELAEVIYDTSMIKESKD